VWSAAAASLAWSSCVAATVSASPDRRSHHLYSIVGRSVCSEGRVRKTFYLSGLVERRRSRPAAPVTVAPTGTINHGRLSAGSCDAAAALRTANVAVCLLIVRRPFRLSWTCLHCSSGGRRRHFFFYVFLLSRSYERGLDYKPKH